MIINLSHRLKIRFLLVVAFTGALMTGSSAVAVESTSKLLTDLIDYATQRSDNNNLPKPYLEGQLRRSQRQADALSANTCADTQRKAANAIQKTISPKELLIEIATQMPQLLIIGETHAPGDFWKWEQDAITEYRKLRPEVDCVFTEMPLQTLDAELKFFGKENYKYTRDIEKTVAAFAKQKALIFQSFRTDLNGNLDFNMKIGTEPAEDTFQTGSFVPRDYAYVRNNELDLAFNQDFKIIPVDMRHRQHNRDVFMATMMSGLLNKGLCKAAVAIVGMAHVENITRLANQDGVSSYSFALWPANAFDLKDPNYGNFHITGFMDYPKTCPTISVQFPSQPFAVVSTSGVDISPRDGEEVLKFTLDSFDANVVAPVLPVKYDRSNLGDVNNIFSESKTPSKGSTTKSKSLN